MIATPEEALQSQGNHKMDRNVELHFGMSGVFHDKHECDGGSLFFMLASYGNHL